MRHISPLIVCLFVAATVLCAFVGTGSHAIAHERDGAHHYSPPCSVLSGCQAASPSGADGIPSLKCDGPLVVLSPPRLSLLIPQLIDHPPEFFA